MARVALTLAFLSFFWLSEAGLALAQTVDAPPAAKKASGKKKGAASSDGDQKASKPLDKAEVQKALDAATAALANGKPDAALVHINTVMSSGGLDSRSTARALSLRGQVYKRQGKPAQAIADLQSALWLKGGLSDAERETAMQVRSEAYREAGLNEPPLSASKSEGRQTAGGPSATVATTGTGSSGSSSGSGIFSGFGGNFLSNIFGGDSGKSAESKPETSAAPAPHRAPSEPAVSSWSQTTSVKPAPSPPPSQHKAAAPARPEPSRAKEPIKTASTAEPAPLEKGAQGEGRYRLQLGAVRSREEAKAVAERVKADHAALVGGRDYDIVEAVFGNMGKFYRVRIGPYADMAESKTVCATLRASGVDCMIITQ